MNTKYKTPKGKERKFIAARKGEESKSEQARQLMIELNGTKTYKEFVDAIQGKTQLSRLIAARYLKVNAKRIDGFKTADGKI